MAEVSDRVWSFRDGTERIILRRSVEECRVMFLFLLLVLCHAKLLLFLFFFLFCKLKLLS